MSEALVQQVLETQGSVVKSIAIQHGYVPGTISLKEPYQASDTLYFIGVLDGREHVEINFTQTSEGCFILRVFPPIGEIIDIKASFITRDGAILRLKPTTPRREIP